MKKTLLIASLGLLSMSLQTQAEELQEFTAKILPQKTFIFRHRYALIMPEAPIQPVSSPK